MHTQAARGDGIHKARTCESAVTATQQRPMHLVAARAICARVLAEDGKSEGTLADEVEIYWYVVAAALEAGIIDETGEYVGELDWTRKMDAYRDWMWLHPKSR